MRTWKCALSSANRRCSVRSLTPKALARAARRGSPSGSNRTRSHFSRHRVVLQAVQEIACKPVVQLRERGRRGQQRLDEIGPLESEAIDVRIEVQFALERVLVRAQVGWARESEFHTLWVQLPSADPAKELEQRKNVKLDTLPGHGSAAAKKYEGYSITCAARVSQLHGRRIADDAQIANESFHACEKVRARHHGVAHCVVERKDRRPRHRQPDCRVPGVGRRPLPEKADALAWETRHWIFHRGGVDAGLSQYQAHVEACAFDGIDDSSDPSARNGRRHLAVLLGLPSRT